MKTIEKIKLYKCGYCINNMYAILKNHKKEIKEFPALVVLIKHKEKGYILFDTGYSQEIYTNGMISKIYNFLNPTHCSENDEICNRLEQDNIDKNKIAHIILSHAHPDHIGGISKFSDYNLIASNEVFETIEHPKLHDLMFKNLKPKNYKKVILKNKIQCSLSKYFEEIYDVFNDKSILAIKLEGHAKGQIGIFIKEYNLFFVADSSWNNYMANNVGKMKYIPKKIQANMKQYNQTIENIKKLSNEQPEIKIIYSHEELIDEIIYEGE